MKISMLCLLMLFSLGSVFAQPARQDTTYVYSNPGYNKDPLRATLRKEILRKDSLWEVNLYKKKQLVETISYADEKLEVRKGFYAFYNAGSLIEEGNFTKGHKHGIWKYYRGDKTLAEQRKFHYGRLLEAISFWDNGNVKARGKYYDGQKLSSREEYYQNEKLASREDYNINGALVEAIYFDEAGSKLNKKPIKEIVN
ncbi:MAG: hypothetical protein EOO47_16265 [Flavobacterium sp.]|nr:MAG: hypothetical protein EOO47_16265 [Flavobacterium sp.]